MSNMVSKAIILTLFCIPGISWVSSLKFCFLYDFVVTSFKKEELVAFLLLF